MHYDAISVKTLTYFNEYAVDYITFPPPPPAGVSVLFSTFFSHDTSIDRILR